MKKIISVIIFGLLCCTSSFADIKRKVLETSIDKAWNINGKFIKPECFENNLMEWMSSDNYEEYYTKYLGKKIEDTFEDKEFRKFVNSIGLYLGKEVPLNDILNTSWDSKISLTLDLKDCLISNPEISVQIKDDDIENYISYEILKNYDLNQAKILAPNLNENFVSIKEIRTKFDGTYSAPVNYALVTYGVINKDGKFLMVPLKQ
jgi:predicted nucleic acid-binding protein